MKKNYFLMFTLLCIAVMLTGCKADDLRKIDYSKPGANTIVIDCRSVWGADNVTSWTADSELGLFCPQIAAKNLRVGLSSPSVGEKQGLFYTKQGWGSGSHTMYLYAPYNKGNTSMKIGGNLSDIQSQSGVSTNHIAVNDFRYAKVVTESGTAPVAVSLKSMFSYLDFAITSASKYAEWNVKSVTISNESKINISGTYTADIEAETFTLDAGRPSVAVRVSSAPNISSTPFHAFAVVVPAALAGVECDVQVRIQRENSEDLMLAGTYTVPSNILAQTTTAIPLELDNMMETELEDLSIDLSAAGTANCYIAAKGGQTYRFNASIMGNGYKTPATASYLSETAVANGITPTVLATQSAQILWQTSQGLISDVKLKKGYIYFTVNGSPESTLTEGNAVIGAYDNRDIASGKIVWSWHIWVTAAPLEKNAETYTIFADYQKYTNYTSPMLMDRNLGATATGLWVSVQHNAQGLKYQWGRKDPFPSSDNSTLKSLIPFNTYNKDNETVATMSPGTALSSDIAWKVIASIAANPDRTAASMVQYPMNFITDLFNWLPTTNQPDDLWGNPFYEEADNKIGHKSIYDPCPLGWRVPHRYTWTGFTKTGTSAAERTNWNATKTDEASIRADGGFLFHYAGTSESPYPATGRINNTNGALFRVGDYAGAYWSSSPNALTASDGADLGFDYNNVYIIKGSRRSFGQAVRCMKEKELN